MSGTFDLVDARWQPQKYETREQWLEAAVIRLSRLFKEIGIELPPVRVSVGWPSKGGLSAKSRVVGQCWKKSVAADGVSQIFISPTFGNPETIQVLGTLVHELIHAWDDCESLHQGEFVRVAKLVGLGGKMTATVVPENSHLAEQLTAIAVDLGDFPNAALVVEEMEKQRKPQTTRMIKLEATDCCGYIVRTTRKWLEHGLPTCPHGSELEEV